MKLTSSDFKEVAELAHVVKKIDLLNADYVNSLSDEIFPLQPFFLTVLLGYRFDVTPEEHDEIIKIYFLIWEYFRKNKNVQTKKVTETYFEKVQDSQIEMLQYIEDESDEKEKGKIYTDDLQKLKSKALLTAVLYRYTSRPVLIKMDEKSKGILFIGIKSFIECFESI